MLGSLLLFKFERPQYAELLKENPDKPLSQIYGAHHFLRLFSNYTIRNYFNIQKFNSAFIFKFSAKIGGVLVYTELNEKSIDRLLTIFQDILKYLIINAGSLFSVQNYGIAPPEYHRKTI